MTDPTSHSTAETTTACEAAHSVMVATWRRRSDRRSWDDTQPYTSARALLLVLALGTSSRTVPDGERMAGTGALHP